MFDWIFRKGKSIVEIVDTNNSHEHNYKFYGLENYYGTDSCRSRTKYKFICTECENVVTLTKTEILSKFDEIKDDYQKEVALGRNDGNEPTISFSISACAGDIGHGFSGVVASRLRNYYLVNVGIDLAQCKIEKY